MKIALIGYGKMGKAIEEIAVQQGHEIVLKISSANADELTRQNLRKADVAIEFTGADTALKNIAACFEAGLPVVSGSTGWLSQLKNAEEICEQYTGTFLYASNFSVGVNIFFAINTRLAELMSAHPEYDVTIEEIHHTMKKDAPSGTAITLAEQVLQTSRIKKSWVLGEANIDQLSIVSKRIDPAPGTHHVKYHSAIDDLEITHTAHSRMGFASGAVLAAAFIKDRKGIFSMKDVLGIT